MVRKEDDDKRAAIFGRFLTLGPFLPVHWLEWKRLEGHGKASLSSRRWLNWRIGTQSRPVSDRSLNLWEQDLAQFEVVSREETAAVKAAALTLDHSKLKPSVGDTRRFSKIKTSNQDQLRLFTLKDL
jgi:hypothetical protein